MHLQFSLVYRCTALVHEMLLMWFSNRQVFTGWDCQSNSNQFVTQNSRSPRLVFQQG